MLVSFWSSNVWPYIVLHWHLITLASVLAAINFLIKWMLILHPVADWVALAEKNPRLASLARLMLALGINPVSAVQALVDLLRGTASPGLKASVKSAVVSASAPLIVSGATIASGMTDTASVHKAIQEALDTYRRMQVKIGAEYSAKGFVDYVETVVVK